MEHRNSYRLTVCFKRILVAAFGFAAASAALHGAAGAGTGYSQGGAFKSTSYGARAWGMGGAAVATVDDESATWWNPGMLGCVTSKTVGASYVNLVPGATAHQSQLVYVHPFGVFEPDADSKAVARHVVAALYTNLLLKIQSGEGYDENTLRVAYAYTPDYFITFAIAADLFASTSDVHGFRGRGTSVDAGLRFEFTENVTVGAVARNAFSRYSYTDGSDHTSEREFALGVSRCATKYAVIEGDVVWAHGGASRWILGAESDYLFDVFALRGGIALITTGDYRTIPYFGFGVRYVNTTLHYNATLDNENAFADIHRFSLSVSL